ncbi:oxidized low-density lipoprotein receptor 1-like [Macrobrachium nipponense]|uniref:oxidized low-density lipoprotein receptor 1-like n=1 Tax=Macrobrachium nipponense TaxID=159736 RepID=UPI0030C822A9
MSWTAPKHRLIPVFQGPLEEEADCGHPPLRLPSCITYHCEVYGGTNLNKSMELINRFRSVLRKTMHHGSCPDLYTLVGDQCLSVFYVGSVSWGEARAFCKVLGGDLLTIKNITQFADIVQHLQRLVLPSSFWIGGSVHNDTVGWTWIDGSPMDMGSPFWATRYTPFCIKRNGTTAKSDETCYHYYQSPKAVPSGECASISFQHSYYISDEDCLRKMSPLCVYQGTDFPKRPEY